MNGFATLQDQAAELVEADIASVVFLKRAAHAIATCRDGKQHSLKRWFVCVVKRALEEDVFGNAHFFADCVWLTLRTASRILDDPIFDETAGRATTNSPERGVRESLALDGLLDCFAIGEP